MVKTRKGKGLLKLSNCKDLDTIRVLKPKPLIELFADVEECDATITYRCHLVPDSCKFCVSNHPGLSKAKAKRLIVDHLRDHVVEIIRHYQTTSNFDDQSPVLLDDFNSEGVREILECENAEPNSAIGPNGRSLLHCLAESKVTNKYSHSQCRVSKSKNKFRVQFIEQSHTDTEPNGGRLQDSDNIPFVTETSSDETATMFVDTESHIPECDIGKSEWEKEFALKCIRMLRAGNKNEVFSCKMCINKSFTSQASLINHYRGHADIKPFMCEVCQKVFTRQHSLKYHMLCHTNRFRFTCEVCSKTFRKNQHYQEHIRSHTGEAPFECSDCHRKFKVRNTYKRHLKVAHGKLLTASGINEINLDKLS